MVRVISQETFDAVVKENMEEFDMNREEAVKEAVEQFQSQVKLAIHATRLIRPFYNATIVEFADKNIDIFEDFLDEDYLPM